MMEEKMNFFFVPSLRQIAVRKTTTILWDQEDIRILLTRHFSDLKEFPEEFLNVLDPEGQKGFLVRNDDGTLHDMKRKVRKKAKDLQIPESVKQDILGDVDVIGEYLYRWVKDHALSMYPGIHLPDKFYWTSQGTINQKENARILIEDENLNIITRYKLACTYCFEKDIPLLWRKIPSKLKYLIHKHAEPLVAIPTFKIRGHVTECDLSFMIIDLVVDRDLEEVGQYDEVEVYPDTCKFDCFAFQYAARHMNKPATECYLQKLNNTLNVQQINKLLFDAVQHIMGYFLEFYQPRLEMLCYLLSQLDSEAVKLCIVETLRCFLSYSYKYDCSEIIKQFWRFLTEQTYGKLLEGIAGELFSKMFDTYFSEAFSYVWKTGKPAYRKYAIRYHPLIFTILLDCYEFENLSLITDELTAAERKECFFYQRGFAIFSDLIQHCEWKKVRFMLERCLKSKNEAMEFKESMQQMYASSQQSGVWVDTDKFPEFYEILDKFISEIEEEKASSCNNSNKEPQLCNRGLKRKCDNIS